METWNTNPQLSFTSCYQGTDSHTQEHWQLCGWDRSDPEVGQRDPRAVVLPQVSAVLLPDPSQPTQHCTQRLASTCPLQSPEEHKYTAIDESEQAVWALEAVLPAPLGPHAAIPPSASCKLQTKRQCHTVQRAPLRLRTATSVVTHVQTTLVNGSCI